MSDQTVPAEPETQPERITTLEELEAAEAAERAPAPDGRVSAYREADAEEAPAEQPAEEKLLAGKYRTPEDLERAYVESQSLIGRHGNELGQLRAELDLLRQQQAMMQAPATPQLAGPEFLPNGQRVLTQTEFEELRDTDPFAAADYINMLRLEEFRAQQEAQQQQMAEPLLAAANQTAARGAIETLRERVGADMLERYKPMLADIIGRNPDRFADEHTRVQMMEDAIYAAAYREGQTTNGAGRSRDERGRFAPQDAGVMGGSGAAPAAAQAQPQSPEDRDIDRLMNYEQRRDALGPIPEY